MTTTRMKTVMTMTPMIQILLWMLLLLLRVLLLDGHDCDHMAPLRLFLLWLLLLPLLLSWPLSLSLPSLWLMVKLDW